MTRLILGGIAAGVVVNIGEFALNQVVLAARMTRALARVNLPLLEARRSICRDAGPGDVFSSHDRDFNAPGAHRVCCCRAAWRVALY
jgi:hypothetical protein